jgi:hypothetical protein
MQGTVRALFVAAERKAPVVPRDQVLATIGVGFDGDFHAKGPESRQILLLSNAVLQEFGLAPGVLFENVVIDGLDVMSFLPGQLLKIGATVLEVTEPCEPCKQMNRVREGLKSGLSGKRGMFAKVISTGTIRVGDAVIT